MSSATPNLASPSALPLQVIFVGSVRQLVPPEAEAEVRALLVQHNCVPVFMEPWLQSSHRNGYAPLVLWPLLHNQIPDRHAGGKGGDGSRVAALWSAYARANDEFAAAIRGMLRQGDMVWVHSYPLLLLPRALRCGRMPKHCIISFFLHSPFPSPEVWRVLPHRAELLQGMLASHVVGFHLFEYARHFMTSCRRLLGLGENVGAGPAGGVLSIDLGSRCVTITVCCLFSSSDTDPGPSGRRGVSPHQHESLTKQHESLPTLPPSGESCGHRP